MEAYARYNKVEKTVERGTQKIENQSAWLTGYIDAEGRFSASQRAGQPTYKMKFSIKENEVMRQMMGIAGDERARGAIVEVESIEMLKRLITYLEGHPLRTRKSIVYAK